MKLFLFFLLDIIPDLIERFHDDLRGVHLTEVHLTEEKTKIFVGSDIVYFLIKEPRPVDLGLQI
jgi:hypothetical protein